MFSVSTAQTVVNTGTVRGVVSDKSGAVVLQASVVLLSRSTGQKQARTTNGAGIFVFPPEAVGPYTLEIGALGILKSGGRILVRLDGVSYVKKNSAAEKS